MLGLTSEIHNHGKATEVELLEVEEAQSHSKDSSSHWYWPLLWPLAQAQRAGSILYSCPDLSKQIVETQ